MPCFLASEPSRTDIDIFQKNEGGEPVEGGAHDKLLKHNGHNRNGVNALYNSNQEFKESSVSFG